jgi:SAM-dependent methyltransferase
MVLAAFEHWRGCGFPYYALSRAELEVEFGRLAKQDVRAVFRSSHANGSCVGLRVANNFQPQMWSVRVSRYRCPMDVFLDDDLLRRAIERAWTIWPDRLGANSSNLRRMLKTFPHTASVSNFRPTLTRAVVERFSSAGSTILDFSAGFGGRLVGCLTLHRNYIGIEPCASQVDGLRKTLRALALHKHEGASARLYKGRAECVLKRIEAESAALVFSSPPYYNWERYSDDPSQSFVRYAGYDKWLTGFLAPCIAESFRTLRPNGYMVLNISGRERRPSRDDVFKIAREVGFTLIEEMPMLLARVPYLHPQNQGAYKPELLLVFRKRVRRAKS